VTLLNPEKPAQRTMAAKLASISATVLLICLGLCGVSLAIAAPGRLVPRWATAFIVVAMLEVLGIAFGAVGLLGAGGQGD
jgi:hypothetical protein